MKYLHLALLAALIGLVVGCGPEPRTVLESEATSAMLRQDFSKAVTLWDQVLIKDPRNADAYRDRANSKVYLGNFQGALKDYDQSLGYAPRVAATYLNRGTVFEALDRWDEAIRDYDRVLDLEPRAVDALNNRGNALGGKGLWTQAIENFRSALIINPRYDLARSNLALALFQMDQYTEALAVLDQAPKGFEQFADAQAGRAVILWRLGKPQAAQGFAQKALSQEQGYGDREWLTQFRRWPPKAVLTALELNAQVSKR